MADMEALGVQQFYMQQAIDSSTPTGRAMLGMCTVFAALERDLIRERVLGIIRAREKGTKSGRPIGRAPLPKQKADAIRAALARGDGIRSIARAVGCSPATVLKVRNTPSR
jgi:DNA invertase Pin-like site-specific DNA recombinase